MFNFFKGNYFKYFALLGVFVMQSQAYGSNEPKGHEIKNLDGSPLIVQWSVLTATPGNISEISKLAVKHVAPETKKEDGTYFIYGFNPENAPDIGIYLEVYRSPSDYDIHVGKPTFANFLNGRRPYLRDLHFIYTDPIVMMSKDADLIGQSTRLTYVEPKTEFVDEYRKLLKEEYTRAVNFDDDVLFMAANSELGNPGKIHSYLLFKDEKARDAYFLSDRYKVFEEKTKDMIEVARCLDGSKLEIKLSDKPKSSL